MPKSRQELLAEWTEALASGTFLTPKHDPNALTRSWASYRTVLSTEISASLRSFIESGSYSITHYRDLQGREKYELAPSDPDEFTTLGASVPSGSLMPSGSMDRLIVLSGTVQGWHVHAEESRTLTFNVASGTIFEVRKL